MTESWPHLHEAAADFRFLLARGYPRKNALDLVGNRYHLNHTARQLLHRGVFAPVAAGARRAKLRRLRDLPGLKIPDTPRFTRLAGILAGLKLFPKTIRQRWFHPRTFHNLPQ